VQVVFVEVKTQPGTAHRPDGRGVEDALDICVAPGVGVVMGTKAAAAVNLAGGFAPACHQAVDQAEKRFKAAGQPAAVREPVGQLGVDVDRVLAFPGRRILAVPETLQIGRQLAVD